MHAAKNSTPSTPAMSSAPPGWISPSGKSGACERYSYGRRLLNKDGTPFDPFTADLPSPPHSRGSSPLANKMAPHANDGDPVTGRRKLKTSDLPLTSAQRGAVEGLAHTFKKKGGYDSLRKSVWEDLEKSNFEASLKDNLLQVAEAELDRNAEQLLKLDRGKATLLIEGAVERAGTYQDAEAQIDALLDKHLAEMEKGIRGLRAEDIGAEAAAEEQARGGKTDAQYAAEATERREKREAERQALRTKEREAADEKRRAERAKRKEEEKRLEAESERRRAEREARRKAEREREEEKERERERDRDRDRDRERDRERARERERERDRDDRRGDRDRNDRYRRHDDEPVRRSSVSIVKDLKETPKTELTKEEIERLEQEALKNLLTESKRVDQRPRYQLEPEVDSSLAPPPRKAMPASAIKPISRDSPSNKGTGVKKIPTGPKAQVDAEGFKTPLPRTDADRDRDRRSYRSRSRDRASSRRSRSRSRHRSRDRESVRSSRRDSRDRDRDSHRRDSRDRDDRRRRDDSRGHRRRDSRSRSRDRRRSYRSRSRSRDRRERDRGFRAYSPRVISREEAEAIKLQGIKDREQEAREWAAARQEAQDKGAPILFNEWKNERDRVKEKDSGTAAVVSTPRSRRDDDRDAPPSRPRESRDRDRERSSRVGKSRSRSPTDRRASRTERSTSPPGIDRYVPGASRRESTTDRRRDRSRSRDRDSRRSRDDDTKARKRSRSRDRSRRRDRSRDRDRDRDRDRRDRRSRSRDHDRDRHRDDRDHDRKRSRSRDSRRESRR
ncbi:hypothetical protein LARI1_G004220 [Lachnellula arida]|uniref:BOD1/SHG1 domain-containing protein n=1 Tax=Lachnellula arida TaxID=1316785 RepID=A0A8T9BCJ1_9HELO|nr:hypothetical protein LARI1_G004220 [Lachnellula arida]